MANIPKTEKKVVAIPMRAEDGGAVIGEAGARLFAGTQLPLATDFSDESSVCDRIKASSPMGYLIEISTMLKGKGYVWTKDGFLKQDATAIGPKFYRPQTEPDFFRFIGMPWTEPKLRKYGTTTYSAAPENQAALTETEVAQWVAGSRWVDSKCGGEAHQWTARVAQQSDEMFLRMVKHIFDFGYHGFYRGRTYRYLDHGDWFYFTQGYKWNETQLINRKLRRGAEAREAQPWVRNPKPFKYSSMYNEV